MTWKLGLDLIAERRFGSLDPDRLKLRKLAPDPQMFQRLHLDLDLKLMLPSLYLDR
jgi:hypothetical protein